MSPFKTQKETPKTLAALMVPAPLQPLVHGVQELYGSSRYTDLTITCKDRQWKVHKFCLCTQSKFFDKACDGGFWEARSNHIDLKEDDPDIVEHFIFYLYNFDYDAVWGKPLTNPLHLDVRMYAMGDKYLVAPLKALAAKKFHDRAQAERKSPEFACAVAEVYRSTASENDPPRKTVVDIIMQHRELLGKTQGSSELLKMLSETPELGADLAVAFASHFTERKYRCPMCAGIFGVDGNGPETRCPKCQAQGPMSEEAWKRYLV